MIFAWRIVAVSDYSANEIRQHLPRRVARKLRVIKNGPSFSPDTYFQPRPNAGKRYILVVGRIEKRKNIHLLVDAFSGGAPSDVDLVVVGSYEPDYAYRMPETPRIRHIINIDDQTLVELYRGAALFVYPSCAEGFGIPLLDSVLFGIPTLSSKLTAMPEVGGNLAEYFDPSLHNAADLLRERIKEHFSGSPVPAPSLEQRLTHAAKLSWDAAADRFLEILAELPE